MDEFLAIALSYPTVVYSVLVVASVMYWLATFVGLADLDSSHGDADAGHLDAGHGDADLGHADLGHADLGHADLGDFGEADGDAGSRHLDAAARESSAEQDDASKPSAQRGGVLDAVIGILAFLRLRNAPLSITLSVVFLTAWILTFFGVLFGLPLLGGSSLFGALIALASLVVAIPVASLATKPLAGLFRQDFAPGAHHLVGRVGVVRIGAAGSKTAQVRLKDATSGERGLLLRVATDEALTAGDEVLLVDFDEEEKAYVAEPMKSVLPKRGYRE